MLSFYHTHHCKNIIAENLPLGRKKWSLQTIILLSDKEVIKELTKEYRLMFQGKNIDDFDLCYNRQYFTPDHQRYNEMSSSMVLAAEFGKIEVVDEILSLSKDVNMFFCNMSMRAAAKNGHIEIVDKMLALGATYYDSAMISAAENGRIEIVNKMLALGANDYNRSMVSAARNGQIEIVDKMIALGANNYATVMAAAANNGYIEIVDKMLALGANNYYASLYCALNYDHIEIANKLLELDYDNIKTISFKNPHHHKIITFLQTK